MGGSAAEAASNAIGSFFNTIISMLPQMLLSAAANAAALGNLPLAGVFLVAAAGAAVVGGAVNAAQNSTPSEPDNVYTPPRGNTMHITVNGDINDADRFFNKVNTIVDQRQAAI